MLWVHLVGPKLFEATLKGNLSIWIRWSFPVAALSRCTCKSHPRSVTAGSAARYTGTSGRTATIADATIAVHT